MNMGKKLVGTGHSSVLFLLKQSCHIMMQYFPEEISEIQELFRVLIFKGKRDVSAFLVGSSSLS